ncbi:cysteine-rich motor neuron 1 protein [Biomphalaria glabrata]|nr:cysteine-rich motor neuron 1 protein [Biomphalaria glabrata]
MKLIVCCILFIEVTLALARIPPPKGCFYDNVFYPIGANFQPNDCTVCVCESYGQTPCAIMDCAKPPCSSPVKIPGQCCPVCRVRPYEDLALEQKALN